MELEVLTAAGRGRKRAFDVVLVHGICTGASIWQANFLPAFAAAGYTVHAPSLRGHGNSPGRERLHEAKLADYVGDLRQIAEAVGRPVVIVGYSLGGAVAQDYLRTGGHAEGVVLMNAVPPYGLGPSSLRLLWRDPLAWQHLALANLFGLSHADPEIARRALFTDRVDDATYARFLADAHDESPLVGMELQGWRPIAAFPWQLPPVLVIGGSDDRLVSPACVRATAAYYGVEPVIVEGMSHGMMLEPDWRRAFDPIADWLNSLEAAYS